MSGIGIITNPHSKLNRRRPDRQKLLGYIVGERGKLELTNSLEDLARVAESFRERGIEVLAINGGDGTVSRTLTAFIRAYQGSALPKVLILRGGTINVLAENLRLQGSPEAILVRYLESISLVRPSTIQRIRCISIDNNYGFLFGNGLVANYLEAFYLNKTGPVGAVMLVIKIYFWRLFQYERFLSIVNERIYDLKLDGAQVQLHGVCTSVIMASTIERMPLGLKLFPYARRSPGQFQVFWLEIPVKQIALRLLAALTFNQLGKRFGRVNRLVKDLTIETKDEKLQKYTLDGELFSAASGKLKLTLGPEIEFIVV